MDALATHVARWKGEFGATSVLEISEVSPGRLRELEPADLVVVRHDLWRAGEWPGDLRAVGRLARTVLVVVTLNPAFVAGRLVRHERVPGTEVLAPLLWDLGRVRDHVYLDAPAWAQAMPRLLVRLARRHAFAVDMRPRTPQARRRLAQATG